MPVTERPADSAAVGIVAANALTLVLALWQGWGLLQLMWPYWMQSVVIGWYARQRMLKLEQFSTADLKMNGRSVEATPETQRRVANFFALHYGIFHLVYFVFLVQSTIDGSADGVLQIAQEGSSETVPMLVGRVSGVDWLIFAVLAVSFWLSHRASHREHVEADLARVPNIGTLMFMPYARVLPMHLTIVLGASLGATAVWVFALLKTGADVVMHKLEHHVLQSGTDDVKPA